MLTKVNNRIKIQNHLCEKTLKQFKNQLSLCGHWKGACFKKWFIMWWFSDKSQGEKQEIPTVSSSHCVKFPRYFHDTCWGQPMRCTGKCDICNIMFLDLFFLHTMCQKKLIFLKHFNDKYMLHTGVLITITCYIRHSA